jgi:SAM-dependent methyltransferase
MDPRLRTLFVFLASALIVATAPPTASAQAPDTLQEAQQNAAADTVKKGAPYVPTPSNVVWKMLELAEISEDDVVYDLGSGDGRIVLAAAQRYGARGVGIEIDPDLVRKARKKARQLGVADRVTFRRGDLFKTDLSDATVVMLYLWPDMNNRLRPKLKRELDPGDRVVSHSFDIDGWAADTTVSIGNRSVGNAPRTLFRWTITDSTSVADTTNVQ